MNRLSRILTAFLVVFGVAVIGACSSEPKDPFDEWNAAQRFDEYVPPSAQPVKNGTGTLTYTTPSNGVLYLLDTTSQVDVQGTSKPKLLVSGYLPTGTEVIFNPQEKRVNVKGKKGIGLTNVEPSHTHELRFDPSAANAKGAAK